MVVSVSLPFMLPFMLPLMLPFMLVLLPFMPLLPFMLPLMLFGCLEESAGTTEESPDLKSAEKFSKR